MRAFLFGGTNNGVCLSVDNYRDVIMMPKEYHTHHDANGMLETEKYIKYNEMFRKKLYPSGVFVQMEDLGIFIHESFTSNEVESLSKIILMVIRAQWEPVKQGF